MNKDTGMVVEIKGKTCIILTPGGEFREVALPSGNVRLGDEITSAAPAKIPAWWKPLLAAAGVFLLLWAGFLYSGWSNEAVAYVGLDINPSVELGLNRRQLVCQAGSLDAEGAALLQKAAVRGLPLEKAIAALLAEAVTSRYLDPARENVVLTTVTAAKDEKREMPAEQQITRYIENALRASGARAEVVVVETAPQVRRQAQEAGLSTGKYLLYLRGAQAGLPVSIEELKEETLAGLEAKKHFKARDLMRDLTNPAGETRQEKEAEIQKERDFPGLHRAPDDREKDGIREQSGNRTQAEETEETINEKRETVPGRDKFPGAGEEKERKAEGGGAKGVSARKDNAMPRR